MLRRKQESMALVMRGKKQLGIVTPTDIIGEIITSIIKD
jgi:CBS domain containing-hemolysin-like protein